MDDLADTPPTSLEQAWHMVAAQARQLPVERCPVDHADGRAPARDVLAAIDLPPFDNSAMDGFALRAVDVEAASEAFPVCLPVMRSIAAGGAAGPMLEPATAVRIMTGAPIPTGADAVVPHELTRFGDSTVELSAPVASGHHVRLRAADVRAGDVLAPAGVELTPRSVALLASAGVPHVEASRRARVALLSTGDELVRPGGELRLGMVHDANRPLLRSLVQRAGAEVIDLGIVGDDPGLIAERISAGIACDVLLVSGGVSVGAHDHVRPVLESLGAQTLFWRLRTRPGRPLLCAHHAGGWVFGLPGNPGSCAAGFALLVEPLLRVLHGHGDVDGSRILQARLTRDTPCDPDRRWLQTGVLEWDREVARVTPTRAQGSSLMRAMADANCLAMLPERAGAVAAGQLVPVIPL